MTRVPSADGKGARIPGAHNGPCMASPASPHAPGLPRWFGAPASQHAALEATLAEQVKSGGHDTEQARRAIWKKEQAKAELDRDQGRRLGESIVNDRMFRVHHQGFPGEGITPAPRLHRFELPSEQRALVKRWR